MSDLLSVLFETLLQHSRRYIESGARFVKLMLLYKKEVKNKSEMKRQTKKIKHTGEKI